ncbi:MAG: hypothetical protein IJW95_01520, partial [Clostridia bacterium]|nr:hypothetical protein [Clostridia bacterium]
MKRTFHVLSCLMALLLSLAACAPVTPPADTDPPVTDPSVIPPPPSDLTPEAGASTAPALDYALSAR